MFDEHALIFVVSEIGISYKVKKILAKTALTLYNKLVAYRKGGVCMVCWNSAVGSATDS